VQFKFDFPSRAQGEVQKKSAQTIQIMAAQSASDNASANATFTERGRGDETSASPSRIGFAGSDLGQIVKIFPSGDLARRALMYFRRDPRISTVTA
jgi:hypothetical protein